MAWCSLYHKLRRGEGGGVSLQYVECQIQDMAIYSDILIFDTPRVGGFFKLLFLLLLLKIFIQEIEISVENIAIKCDLWCCSNGIIL